MSNQKRRRAEYLFHGGRFAEMRAEGLESELARLHGAVRDFTEIELAFLSGASIITQIGRQLGMDSPEDIVLVLELDEAIRSANWLR